VVLLLLLGFVYVLKKEKFFLLVIEFPSEMHPAVNDYRKLFNQSTCDALVLQTINKSFP
jgi:hypothetical protein